MSIGSLVLGLLIGLVSGVAVYWLLDCGAWASIFGFLFAANLAAASLGIWNACRR